MNKPSQEDMLGYVLGALDAPEQKRIQQLIDEDPSLEEELLRIRSSLAPLDELDAGGGPRPGLARRTCEAVACCVNDPENNLPPEVLNQTNNLDSAIIAAFEAADQPAELTAEDKPTPRLRDRLATPKSWSMTDMLTGVALMAIMASILFPTISYTRFNSRVADCQNNLRQIGTAMMNYSDINGGMFVAIPTSGNLSVSGCYAPMLKDAGLIDEDQVFACAGVGSQDKPMNIPSCDQICDPNLSPEQVVYLRRTMGGHYGYTMGYLDNGSYCAPRNMGRINVVLLADQPSLELDGRRSQNHGGKGQNCLFEDGRVEFVKGHAFGGDAIFENDYGVVAPGSSAWDNVIAPSHLSINLGINQ